jgi:hypothetical protein
MRLVNVVLCTSLALAACAPADKGPVSEDFSDLAALDEKSDAFSYRMKYVGTLTYGATSDATTYTDRPRFRYFKVTGAAGDTVDLWVRATDGGDPVTWLLDASYRVVGSNDDAADGSGLDSHIEATLTRNGTHYVVFRDYDLLPGRFVAELRRGGGAACEKDAECTGLSTPADSAALCEESTCSVVAAEEIACGGRRLNPHSCPSGWVCRGAGLAYDASGRCEREIPCGGLAGLVCPDGQECVDVPDDTCDPATGGADCIGVCHPTLHF